MAQEITVIAGLAFSKGSSSQEFGPLRKLIDMAGEGAVWHRQTIGTSAEAVTIPADIASAGWCIVVNRDDENFVNFRIGSGGSNFAKLLPGEPMLLRLASNDLYGIADTGPCEIEYLVVET